MDRDAPKGICEDPCDGYGDIQADDCICGIAKCGTLEDSQEEQTDGDFGERDLDLVYEDKGVETLEEGNAKISSSH